MDPDFFEDELAPRLDELRRWSQADADLPMQDWDLMLAESEQLDTLLTLACEPGPKTLLQTSSAGDNGPRSSSTYGDWCLGGLVHR